MKEYTVRYENSIGEDIVIYFESEYEAENNIETELENEKQSLFDCKSYDYGEFSDENGNILTEIWEDHPEDLDNKMWSRWTRLYSVDRTEFGL